MTKPTDGNRTLYFWQGLACLSVVLIHCPLPSWVGVAASALARFAVPLFFMTSGYYLRCDDWSENQTQRRLDAKIRHFSCLLMGWMLFYLLWTLLRAFTSGSMAGVSAELTDIFALKNVLEFLLLGDTTLIGGHLWFIAALLFCYLLLRCTGCKWLNARGGSMAALLICVHVFGRIILAALGIDEMIGVPVYRFFRNGVLMALPFVLLGDWMRRNQARVCEKVTMAHLIALLICGAALAVLEAGIVYRLAHDDREIYLGTLPMVLSIFIMTLKYPDSVRPCGLIELARRDAQSVYLVHMWVIDALGIVIAKAGLALPIIAWIKPFAVMAVSVLVSVLLRVCRETFSKKYTA